MQDAVEEAIKVEFPTALVERLSEGFKISQGGRVVNVRVNNDESVGLTPTQITKVASEYARAARGAMNSQRASRHR